EGAKGDDLALKRCEPSDKLPVVTNTWRSFSASRLRPAPIMVRNMRTGLRQQGFLLCASCVRGVRRAAFSRSRGPAAQIAGGHVAGCLRFGFLSSGSGRPVWMENRDRRGGLIMVETSAILSEGGAAMTVAVAKRRFLFAHWEGGGNTP